MSTPRTSFLPTSVGSLTPRSIVIRSRATKQFDAKLDAMKAAGEDTTRFERTKFMCEYHEKITQLAERVANLLEEDQFSGVGILTGGGPGERK